MLEVLLFGMIKLLVVLKTLVLGSFNYSNKINKRNLSFVFLYLEIKLLIILPFWAERFQKNKSNYIVLLNV